VLVQGYMGYASFSANWPITAHYFSTPTNYKYSDKYIITEERWDSLKQKPRLRVAIDFASRVAFLCISRCSIRL
jgi:hypothetical protein